MVYKTFKNTFPWHCLDTSHQKHTINMCLVAISSIYGNCIQKTANFGQKVIFMTSSGLALLPAMTMQYEISQ